MSNSFDDNNNDDDNFVRPPDKTISEQLMEDNRSDYEREIDEAIYLSIRDFELQQSNNLEYEKKILQNYENEKLKRKEEIDEILFVINKLSKFDNDYKEIYNIIEPILELYCSQNINNCYLDNITYHKIITLLEKTRINKLKLENLKRIILSEN